MRWLTPTTATLIVAILALLLVGYVFGAADPRPDQQAADATSRKLAANCSSRQTSELLKRELFGRATALRGRDQAAMAQAARYSAVRVESATATKVNEGSGDVTCSASLVLDLPPEMAVVGGRHSLASKAEYQVIDDDGGQPQLRLLSNPDGIVTPLAALTGVTNDAPQTFDVQSPDAGVSAPMSGTEAMPPPPPPPVQAGQPQTAQRRATLAPPARAEAARRPPSAQPPRKVAAAPAPRSQAPPKASPPVRRPEAPAPERPAAESPPPQQAASARPSFDCRRARARSEIAICSDAGLASLDRQMSAQFFSALRAARPGQRALLQRSRNRFLAYRNSCGSQACIADAYRDRMREIDAIMNGGF